MRSATTEQSETSLLIAESPCDCGGLLAVFVGDYVSWGRCIDCRQPRVISWVSCQAGSGVWTDGSQR